MNANKIGDDKMGRETQVLYFLLVLLLYPTPKYVQKFGIPGKQGVVLLDHTVQKNCWGTHLKQGQKSTEERKQPSTVSEVQKLLETPICLE